MSVKKTIISHLFVLLIALSVIGLFALVPTWFVDGIGAITLILAICVAAFMGIIFLKHTNKISCVLLALVLATPCFAREPTECDMYGAATQEGKYCRFQALGADVGSDICQYIKSFDPSNLLTGDKALELRRLLNKADKLVQGYSSLGESYRGRESGACRVLTVDERKKTVAERQKILSRNNTPLCCAWALQTLGQIYNSRNGERQIETVPSLMSDERMQCWPCDVVYLLITVANTIAYRSAPQVAKVALFLLKWFFIFWLVLKIGALFLNRDFATDDKGKPQEYDGKKFLKELFARVCWAGLAALVLLDTAEYAGKNNDSVRPQTMLDQAYQKVVNPPFEMIAAVGIEMVKSLVKGEESFYGRLVEAAQTQPEAQVYSDAMKQHDYCEMQVCPRYVDANGYERVDVGCLMGNNPMYQRILKDAIVGEYELDVVSQGRVIEDSTTRNLLCLTQLAFRGLTPIAAAGSIITSFSIKNAESLPFPLPGQVPCMPEIFYGVILTIVCWLFGVAVGFRLIDIMVRVAMMVMLCPLFFVLAVFPATRTYAKKGVAFFISAVMGFIEVALAIGFIVPIFQVAIAEHGNADKLLEAMVAPTSSVYVTNLYEQFSGRGMKFFLIFAAVGWMAFKLLEQVDGFFSELFTGTKVTKMASEATMGKGVESVRQFMGDHYDIAQHVKLMERLGNTRLGRGVKKTAGSIKSAGRKAYESAKGSAAGRFVKKAGEASGKAIDKASTAVGSGLQKGGKDLIRSGARTSTAGYGLGAIVGIPMMLAGVAAWLGGGMTKTMGKVGKYAVKNAKNVGKFAKEQAKKGVYDFFHPEEKGKK